MSNGRRSLRAHSTAATLGALALAACADPTPPSAPAARPSAAAASQASSGVAVLLRGAPTDAILADLATIGPVLDVIPQLDAVTMRATAADLPAIRAKSYVADASLDVEVRVAPVHPTDATSDFAGGLSSWDQDAIGVTVAPGTGRNPALDGLTGAGVYIGVLDTGLLSTWPQYFPADRIATEYARAFGGGGADVGTVSSQPNKWQQDTDSHGTHVTSSILGFVHPSGVVNGTAPRATVIPVKVLNQSGSGWSSTIARGIVYVADLKAGALGGRPTIISMSLGGGRSPIEERAIDYAIKKGAIVVAAAGNEGTAGMSWPGAYAPVISVAASGWVHEWEACGGAPVLRTWWRACDVPEPTRAGDFYIAGFSSRQKPGQQLDVAAPGSWVVGPYQTNNGQTNWFFLGGTSMATPHVSGVVALMAERKPSLTAAEAEAALKRTAIPLAAGSRTVFDINRGRYVTVSWGADATGAGLVDAPAAVKAVR
jgi:subtilisin family serine protease